MSPYSWSKDVVNAIMMKTVIAEDDGEHWYIIWTVADTMVVTQAFIE